MRAELETYLRETFDSDSSATTRISSMRSIGGQIHIRFELGDELPNGTKARVEQATQRAVALFEDTFENPENEIWILIYDHLGEQLFGRTANFLEQQFTSKNYAGSYDNIEMVDTGNDETQQVRVIIGRYKVKNINFKNILNAIANTEMGFKPTLTEEVFFVDSQTNRMFHMYDDRGCYVWSNSADNIRYLYLKRSSWIVDYHRAEIDKYFQQ